MGRIMWVGGLFSVLAVVLHVFMHRQFGLDPGIQGLSLANQSVLYTLNACIAYVMLVFAYLSFFQWRDLISTRLGHVVAIAMAFFWFVRAAAEPLFAGLEPGFPVLPVLLFVLPGVSYIVPLLLRRSGAASQPLDVAGASASKTVS